MASSIDNAFITQYGRRKNMGIVVVKKPKLKSVDPVLRRAAEVLITQEKFEEEEAAKKKKPKKTKSSVFQKRREIISGAAGSGLSISARQKYLLTGNFQKNENETKRSRPD